MKLHKLSLLLLGACVACAAFAQDKPDAAQGQSNQSRASASASLKLRAPGSAHAATGIKDSQQQDPRDRRERAEKVGSSLMKKTNETASAAASNVK